MNRKLADVVTRIGKRALNVRQALLHRRMARLASRDVLIGICGNYTTGNIGDQAIGWSLARALKRLGMQPTLYHHRIGATDSQVTVLGGGGVIHDHREDLFDDRISFLNGVSVIVGVGFQGLSPENARRLSTVLDRSSHISARDERSQRALQSLTHRPVLLSACPAFAIDFEVRTAPRAITGVNFRPWFGAGAYGDPTVLTRNFGYPENFDVQTAQAVYLSNLNTICSNVEDPVYIPFDRGDYRFARKYLSIPVLPYFPSVSLTLSRVSRVSRMVCTRYHSHVFAALFGKPIISLAYAPKVVELAGRIEVPIHLPHEPIREIEFVTPNPERVLELRALALADIHTVAQIASQIDHRKPTGTRGGNR